ncbi:glycosyltransferase family 4 protein [Microcella sp.]|uniref:glycosyltransferase family 4 protein n=1 Tax=Microcella sp. TaxID=1913979 RepID=UPI0039195345
MRVLIASRIYAPEPGAAPQRLAALAAYLADEGHDVEVVTARAPRALRGNEREYPGVHVRRAPVLRDREGFVRGYLPYLSFDIPLVWRLLTTRRPDVIVVEPPPTTGAAVRTVARLRRIPAVYYVADILADAASSAGVTQWIVRAVRRLELYVWRGCAALIAVSEPVVERLRELQVPPEQVRLVGNGIDTSAYGVTGPAVVRNEPYALYAGTASDVHGAGIFVEAMASVDNGQLVFVGSGTDRVALRRRADDIAPGRVHFIDAVSPEEVAAWFRGAALAVASVKPTGGYEFAFPTKLYAAVACGTPVLFTGNGPGAAFADSTPLGASVPYEVDAVARHLRASFAQPAPRTERIHLAQWAARTVSMTAITGRIATVLAEVVSRGPRGAVGR